MGDSKFQIEETHKTRIVDEQEWISSWLRDADGEEGDRDVVDAGNFGEVEPVTPPRRPAQLLYYDEISPTSTSFSRGSVFDTPEVSGNPGTGEDPFCDDISGITSVLNLEAGKGQDNSEIVGEDYNNFEIKSFASYDPPSEIDEDLTHSINNTCKALTDTAALPIDPRKPRITWITSCTQCTLADLPCSRTTPCCSRCKRNGQANVCLLHRRKFRDEIERSESEACTKPVLLKLKGDDESHWREKLRLADEVRL
ncbi:hypothetical protein EKO04_007046 [Ascochyta lentis]|uniref:Uncharacterized protein n=1 Tax=Ascochyta lentis TaxID=205686 RepID=A0A8H7J1G6_9PLEO|nr:hypothetical protein EKO04_007046 [Ascochyta lentis]